MSTKDGERRADPFADAARQSVLLVGIGAVVLGVTIVVWPQKTVTATGVLFGLCLLLSGISQLVVAVGLRTHVALRLLIGFSAVLSTVLAGWCLHSRNWIQLLALWIGLGWAIRGIVQAIVAVCDDALPWHGRQEALGVVTLVAGIVVVIVPVDSLSVLAAVVGLCLIALGALEIRTTYRRPRAATAPQFPAPPAAEPSRANPH